MRHPRRALLLSALFSAAVIAALAFVVASKGGLWTSGPIRAVGVVEVAPDTSRLMPPEDPGISLFLDAERDLLLKYPSGIVPIRDRARMETSGYVPVCDPLHALVCFPLDPPEYADTNFDQAAFAIHLRDDLETEAECLAAQPAEDVLGAVLLGETVFSAFTFGDAAMSHRLDGRNYRAFREGDCYELATRVLTTAYGVYEPGMIREFTVADEAAVRAELERILKSFRFQADLELL